MIVKVLHSEGFIMSGYATKITVDKYGAYALIGTEWYTIVTFVTGE